jgi:L-lactate dehydrogenase complex protein LldG
MSTHTSNTNLNSNRTGPDTAREAMLQRIRGALHDVPASEQPAAVAVTRDYQQESGLSAQEITHLFIERTVDYKAIVHHINASDLAARIAQSCAARDMRRLLVPADLPDSWLGKLAQTEIDVVRDTGQLSYAELDACDGVLTGCALAIAQTGTIVLDSGSHQGRRAITLIPDYHLCVVEAQQIAGIVPEAISQIGQREQGTGARRPLTFISGPSATSDIELNRVEGVHGPRTLEVIVVG